MTSRHDGQRIGTWEANENASWRHGESTMTGLRHGGSIMLMSVHGRLRKDSPLRQQVTLPSRSGKRQGVRRYMRPEKQPCHQGSIN